MEAVKEIAGMIVSLIGAFYLYINETFKPNPKKWTWLMQHVYGDKE